jgi:hypothetical protein
VVVADPHDDVAEPSFSTWYVERPMIRQIAPQFFTTEMAATLAYYKDKQPTVV